MKQDNRTEYVPGQVFVYGFGPFKEFSDNVTERIVGELAEDAGLSCHIFNVCFDRSMFVAALEEVRPAFILGLGQTRRGEKLRIERLARNVMSDDDQQIAPCPIEAECNELTRAVSWDLPLSELCEWGDDAGTYVCNFSMWISECWARANGARFAFIHVPRVIEVDAAVGYIRSIIFPKLSVACGD